MKPRLLELLMCPWCRADLTMTAFDGAAPGGDVGEGLLTCACGRSFPIVNGIPRILENAFALFPDFVNQHRDTLPALPDVPVLKAREAEAIRRTRESIAKEGEPNVASPIAWPPP